MKTRIVIIVDGGIVDYISDPNVEVLSIDTDNIEDGYQVLTNEDIKGFEDLVPDWIKTDYIREQSFKEGWCVSSSDEHGTIIEKWDDDPSEVFASDAEALSWVKHRASAGSEYHINALKQCGHY